LIKNLCLCKNVCCPWLETLQCTPMRYRYLYYYLCITWSPHNGQNSAVIIKFRWIVKSLLWRHIHQLNYILIYDNNIIICIPIHDSMIHHTLFCGVFIKRTTLVVVIVYKIIILRERRRDPLNSRIKQT